MGCGRTPVQPGVSLEIGNLKVLVWDLFKGPGVK